MAKICRIEECNQPIVNRETTLCHKHHLRLLRFGTTELSRTLVDKSKKCKVKNCKRHQQTNINVCLMHYKRFKRYGVFELPKRINRKNIKCKFCINKIGKSGALGMCSKHYQMWKLHGDPFFTEKKRVQARSNGYIRKSGGQAFHRNIAEEKIGRKLIKRLEVVHHIDLDKLNNNPNNLAILTKSTHAALHMQLGRLAGELIRIKLIVYRGGKYHLNF